MNARTRYLYCGCGSVFHAETASDAFDRHTVETNHPALSVVQVDRYIDRICQVCLKARGVKAFGFFQLSQETIVLYSWVCKRCIGELVGVRSSAS